MEDWHPEEDYCFVCGPVYINQGHECIEYSVSLLRLIRHYAPSSYNSPMQKTFWGTGLSHEEYRFFNWHNFYKDETSTAFHPPLNWIAA